MINPFASDNTDLVSLSSGAVADDLTKRDLLSAEAIGERKLEQFTQSRIVTQEIDFF